MKEHFLSAGTLLDQKGNLAEAGYATSLIKKYDRTMIKVRKGRIKEWDYYLIYDENYGVALTIDDNGYMGMASVSVLDFKNKCESTKSYIKWFTYGKLNLPNTSVNGDCHLVGDNYDMHFYNDHGNRHLVCKLKNLRKDEDFSCDITLEETNPNSMAIATPFKKKKHFYYNQKINLLKAKGYFQVGLDKYTFGEKTFGGLDWGRGVWTYSNTWYWSSLNTEYNGHRIGFNLGYGFGDTKAASENMLFYDDKAYKFTNVSFNIPVNRHGKCQFLKPWTFTSVSGDIFMNFEPIIDRASNTNVLIIQSDQHQVFGYFSGYFMVDGQKVEFDHLLGFAEKVKNRW